MTISVTQSVTMMVEAVAVWANKAADKSCAWMSNVFVKSDQAAYDV